MARESGGPTMARESGGSDVCFIDSDEDTDDGGVCVWRDAVARLWQSCLEADCVLVQCEQTLLAATSSFADKVAYMNSARCVLDECHGAANSCSGIRTAHVSSVATLSGAVEGVFFGGVLTIGSNPMCACVLPGLADVHACMYMEDGSVFMRSLEGGVQVSSCGEVCSANSSLQGWHVGMDSVVVGGGGGNGTVVLLHWPRNGGGAASVTVRLANPPCVRDAALGKPAQYEVTNTHSASSSSSSSSGAGRLLCTGRNAAKRRLEKQVARTRSATGPRASGTMACVLPHGRQRARPPEHSHFELRRGHMLAQMQVQSATQSADSSCAQSPTKWVHRVTDQLAIQLMGQLVDVSPRKAARFRGQPRAATGDTTTWPVLKAEAAGGER